MGKGNSWASFCPLSQVSQMPAVGSLSVASHSIPTADSGTVVGILGLDHQ
jgi:hypothetical protein